MITTLIAAAALVGALALLFAPRRAEAHCDTMDGPTAKDGKKALESGKLNYAAKWIPEEGEEELEAAFALARVVREQGAEAKELADRYFLETLVRLHRAGEGAPYSGLKPEGLPLDPRVAAADRSIALGKIDPLAGLVPAEELKELEKLLARALALKDFELADLDGARAYIAAYVDFFKFAEGEEHHHEHAHDHGHDHDHDHHHDQAGAKERLSA